MGAGTSKEPLLTVETTSLNRHTKRNKDSSRFNCFSLFCPPSKSNDPLGTPMPSQPMDAKHNRKQFYGGLEVEESMRSSARSTLSSSSRQYHRNGNRNSTSNGSTNGHGHYSNASSHSQQVSSATIYDGEDGEQRLMKKYQMCEVLGVGSTSVCHRCVNRKTGKSFACKIIDKVQIEERFEGMIEQFHMEIEALKCLHHPNIIKLYDVYTTSLKIYIVMELMAGGELFDYVVKKGTLTEAEASAIVRMVTSALVYMHDQNIIHRDLKPENLLLTHKPNSMYDIEVKIIDFGLSKVS